MKRLLLIIVTFLAVASLWLFQNTSTPIHYQDTNTNDIWDDMEPFIKKTSQNKLQEQALRDVIRAYQGALLSPETGKKIRDGNRAKDHLLRSSECMWKVWGGSDKAPQATAIKNVILNSDARIKSWIEYNRNLSGGVYSLWNEETEGNPCSFEVPGSENE